ncbi:MAG: bifunctional 4-hydroxy-3-methylbut-2-enyl diphosphate reductase/30S ribosomal protein S1 [Candidatus Heteroscillospira sp.]|jgi:ribosomal protein S1/(E)-4-hydroxy-3-methyl-but-2-enyl pyrophosphate reductase
MREVITAKSAGFCFGVGRAVSMAQEALKEGPCYCLGDIIHNRDVVDSLAAAGLRVIDTPEELPEGERVIIRSHGVSRDIYRRLEERRAVILDATCPKVAHIHKIVSRASEAGRLVAVIGAAEHPEVQAICGWCGPSVVLSDREALVSWLAQYPENREKPLSVVFQTTQTQKNLDECVNFLKKEYTNCESFDTICNATSLRQQEAMKLAAQVDAMIVIGGRHSANSMHLADICSEICANTQFIENARELDMTRLEDADTVGITAGASAPAWIIKEVKHKMTDEIKIEEMTAAEAVAEEEVEKTFDQMLEDSLKPIYNGDTVTGIVAAITPTEISVDLSTKHSGYIPVSEFTDDPSVKIADILKVGDTVEASVVRVNDVEGTVMLSKKRLDAVKNWNDIEVAREEGTVVEGTVTEENKGGVVVSVRGIRVFVPASQTGLGRDVPMAELLKKKVRLRITEVNRSRRRVVGSIRAVQAKERKEKAEQIWNEIEVGKHYNGVVKSLTSYGAFVDIGGVDGMVHVSELSWNRIKQPSDVVAVGDDIDVFVLNFDKDSHKISLGHKKAEDNPWAKFTGSYNVGDVASVKVVKLMPFGAFAEVMPGVDGLIHISQIANRRIGKPGDVLTVGEAVDAKITGIDNDNQKISLSIRALSEPEAPAHEEEEEREYAPAAPADDALVYEVSTTGEATGNQPEIEE